MPPISRRRPRAARRPSSTARCSIPPTRPPTSRACRSSASRCEPDVTEDAESHAMNMPLVKTEPMMAAPARPAAMTAAVLPLAPPQGPPLAKRMIGWSREIAARVVPPAIVIALGLLVWELVCRKAGGTLPPPPKVINDTWELITHPFYDRGGLDKGLFWHLSASLQRVAKGYGLAAIGGGGPGQPVGQEDRA